MPDVCLYFQCHQPYRLRRYRLFDIGTELDPFDEEANRAIVERVAGKCYLPANRLLARLQRESGGALRVAFGLTGTLLEQLGAWVPDALESFGELVAAGAEVLGETYHHSLAALADPVEFEAQVRRHTAEVERRFGVRPTIFRNTELIWTDALGPIVRALGFRAALVEGADPVLGWRSPNHVYRAAGTPSLRLLPRHYRLSDDVGFRFSNRAWDGWPVTAERYAEWIAAAPGESVHLFLDYETFGEHQWEETGIFEFLRRLPEECRRRGIRFVSPSELAGREPVGELSFPAPTSWADEDRGVTAWLGNRMQAAAHERLYRLGEAARSAPAPLRERWRRLGTSDHLYYMCTKWFSDGDVHKYFSPWETPYDAFIAYMNVLQDLEQRLEVWGGLRHHSPGDTPHQTWRATRSSGTGSGAAAFHPHP